MREIFFQKNHCYAKSLDIGAKKLMSEETFSIIQNY